MSKSCRSRSTRVVYRKEGAIFRITGERTAFEFGPRSAVSVPSSRAMRAAAGSMSFVIEARPSNQPFVKPASSSFRSATVDSRATNSPVTSRGASSVERRTVIPAFSPDADERSCRADAQMSAFPRAKRAAAAAGVRVSFHFTSSGRTPESDADRAP